MRVTKFDRVVWWNCTRAAAGRWRAMVVEQVLKARHTGGMNPSPANHYRVVVGRPALWPPRTFAVLYNFMGCHCRGRRPRRPAEGPRPLPANRSKTGLRTKKSAPPPVGSGAQNIFMLCQTYASRGLQASASFSFWASASARSLPLVVK